MWFFSLKSYETTNFNFSFLEKVIKIKQYVKLQKINNIWNLLCSVCLLWRLNWTSLVCTKTVYCLVFQLSPTIYLNSAVTDWNIGASKFIQLTKKGKKGKKKKRKKVRRKERTTYIFLNNKGISNLDSVFNISFNDSLWLLSVNFDWLK